MECFKCPIADKTCNRCSPKGTNNPMIYFVGEAMGPDESKSGVPFVGSSGKLFHSLIEVLGLNELNCRFNYLIKCFPSNSNGEYRSPDIDEIENCIDYLYEDIDNTNPKVIVTLGTTAGRTIVGERFTKITNDRGNIYDVDIKGKTYKVVTTYHPTFILRNDREDIEVNFRKDIKLAMRSATDETVVATPSLSENLSETTEIYNYEDFDKFCKEQIDDFDTVAYDIETNALEVHSEDYKVVGFSLASNSSRGCYVTLEAIDFLMESEDKKKIEDKLREILLNKKVIVFNCMHEIPATLNWLDIEIPDFEDIFIMVKLMMGNANEYEGNGGLKVQCMLNLHTKDWSKDLDDYADAVRKYSSKNKDIKDASERKLKEILNKYYTGDMLNVILRKVKYYAEEVIPNHKEFSYGYVPSKLISRYGSIDSSILFDLKDFYEKWMRDYNEKLGIDLFKGYKYWKWHHYAGYILERNGAYWNDEKAKKVEKWCRDGILETLRNIIKSPVSRDYIVKNAEDLYYEYVYNNYCDQLVDPTKFKIVRRYSKSLGVTPNNEDSALYLKRMSIIPNKQGIYKLDMNNILHMGKKFIESSFESDIYKNWLNKYLKDITDESKTLEDLKKIINPNSSNVRFRDYVSNKLITPIIKYAKFYDNIAKFVDEPSFDLNTYLEENANNEDECRLISMIYKFKLSDIDISKRFDWFLEFLNETDRKFNSWKMKKLTKEAFNYHFESMDSETFNQIYELYLMCHIDVEDRTTWNDEFEWMFNYKMNKKFAKLLSTYINGVVGRANVYEVDKKSYQNGDILTRRGKKYDGNLPDDKLYMMQAKFKVNVADTGRWTAGMHNLPASDAIKGIFTSRFPGGCVAMPDGSQMEVRTLAAESGDESLLKAFKDGVDIHRFFASRIYSVPYDEVQKWQRGLAKNAVFGMLYGENEQTFANTYLSGDVARAKEIYDGMFTGFPRIKDYIDRKHSQYENLKMVTTLTQRYINLANAREDPNRLLRQSQNYPIQASAEDIAGVILYKLCEWLKTNKMKSKPFCFIHDSIEIDMHPDEVFMIIEKLDYLFNKFPLEEFGVPVACDVPLSMSMGAEIDVAEIICKDNYNDITITLDGFQDDIEELIENWKNIYKFVEEDTTFEHEPDKPVYMPISERFLPKKAPISMKQGSYRNSIQRKYHVIVK